MMKPSILPRDLAISRRDLARLIGAAAAAHMASTAAKAAWAPNDRVKSGMIVRSGRQDNLEMPMSGFLDELTPVEHFFTRSHHYPAKVELSTWKLEITGAVSKPQNLDFETIRKLPKVETVAVCECAGNGRGFYEPSMPGLQWGHGGVGNAKWGGVRLADVLELAGADRNAAELVFDGADVPIGTMPEFLRSIPTQRGFAPDTLLAYEMNGQPLPSAHGFPLRVVVPGWASDCWVKWLTKIDVSKTEFDGFFMKSAYRHPGRGVRPGYAVDPAAMSPVTRLRAKSVIAYPADGAEVAVGKPLNIRGVGWTGDGNKLSILQISLDGGRTWISPQGGTFNGNYAWRTWQYNYTPDKEGYVQISVRCGDDHGDFQPIVQSWNPSGYLWNVIHTIGVNVVKEPKAAGAVSSGNSRNPMPNVVKGSCGGCHEDDVIHQQRLSRGQWDKEVDKMARWGSKFKPSDKEAIVDYLAKEYPYVKRF